jgi:hypothetical protein
VPPRARDLARVLAEYGVVITEPSSGSHWKLVRGSVKYTLTLHAGLKSEVTPDYIRGLCHAFGIERRELMRKL